MSRRAVFIGIALTGIVVVAFFVGRSTAPVTSMPASMDIAAGLVAAELDQQAESGEYLPPTDANLIRLLEDWSLGDKVVDRVVSITQYSEMPDVTATDLFGRPTGSDPSQWYRIELCSGGALYRYDANPYTVSSVQDALVITVSGEGTCTVGVEGHGSSQSSSATDTDVARQQGAEDAARAFFDDPPDMSVADALNAYRIPEGYSFGTLVQYGAGQRRNGGLCVRPDRESGPFPPEAPVVQRHPIMLVTREADSGAWEVVQASSAEMNLGYWWRVPSDFEELDDETFYAAKAACPT